MSEIATELGRRMFGRDMTELGIAQSAVDEAWADNEAVRVAWTKEAQAVMDDWQEIVAAAPERKARALSAIFWGGEVQL